jgi:hypothetical protein
LTIENVVQVYRNKRTEDFDIEREISFMAEHFEEMKDQIC